MKKTIMFTIEHKERELIPKIFLAYKLALKGFRVYIGTSSTIDTIAHKLKPSIFFHKSSMIKKSAYYKSLGHKFIYMDEEGGITTPRSNTELFCQDRYMYISKDKSDAILLPGKRFMKCVKNMTNTNGIELYETGWPRVDLWQSKYKYLHDENIQSLKSKYGSYYLLITSFGMTNKKTYEERMKHKFPYYKKLYKHKYHALLNYIELINDLSKLMNNDEKLIIRPHPSESLDDWKSITKKFDNVVVVRDGDITPWILASESIVQYGSTTATQASLNGINCIQYKVDKQDGITDTASFELCQDANTAEEVYNMLRVNKGKFDNLVYERAVQYLKEEMAFDENELAVDKIVKILEGIKREKVQKPNLNIWDVYLKPELSYIRNIYKTLYYKVNKLTVTKKTVLDKIPNGITSNEITNYLNILNKNDKKIYKLNIEQVCRNLICIEKG